MSDILRHLTHQHDLGLLGLAVVICVSGAAISALLSRRLSRTRGHRRHLQLGLTSIISGATIWSTHFLAMLAYHPGLDHGYDPWITGLSLLVAIGGLLTTNAIVAYGSGRARMYLAGAGFGLTVAMMHYTGMSAYLLPGSLLWDPGLRVVSILLGMAFGAAAFQQMSGSGGLLPWLSSTLLLVTAICAVHFTGMAAFAIVVDTAIEVPANVLSDEVLGALIVAVTIVILLIGLFSFSIESNLENETRAQLRHAALHDPLTGLPNRMGLAREISDLSKLLAGSETGRVAVLTIDLNLFKQVNDLHGHAVGDELLITLAARFAAALEEDEFVARAGGDEFVALKRDFRRIDQVLAFAERLHAMVVEPVETTSVSATVGAAIGIATSLADGRDVNDLLHKSDLAMYRAKSEPDCHICLYNAEIDRQSHDRKMLVHDLRQALAREEFELVFQLQNDITSLEATGFEVLLRWNHPTRGRIPPAEFIPIAEETGLIREIGLWVLRTACIEAADWPVPYEIAVNVAPQQIVQPSFAEHVADILMETGFAPERLELEVTEASIIDDQANTLRVMHRLKSMGVRIAMDDFGTGYSSLATLKAFPFDKIKIDRSFVQDVHSDDQRAAIVRSTLILGNALNIPVLAEGVEKLDELDFLALEKCDAAQGFYFGQPMSRDEMRRFIATTRDRKAS